MSSPANDRQRDSASSRLSAAPRSQQLHSHSSVPIGSVKVIDNFPQPITAPRAGLQATGVTLHRVGSTGAFRPDDTEVSRSQSNLYNLQALVDTRKNSFSAPDEVLLERKGSGDSQAPFLLDRASSSIEGHTASHWSPYAERHVPERPAAASSAVATSLSRGTSRLAAEAKVPEWLSPAHTRPPSLQGDGLPSANDALQYSDTPSSSDFEADTTATLNHLDNQQAQVSGSLQQLHVKLDSVAKALGITLSGPQAKIALISAHHGPEQHEKEEVQQQVNSLISQVEATLQRPSKPPSATIKGSRADSSSIGTVVQKQLDSVSEQLASQGSAAHRHTGSAQLSAGLSNVIDQLHLAEQATSSAHALAGSVHKQQAGADIPERLHTASRAIAAALTNSSQLQQQIRVQALTQPSKSSQTVHQPVGDEPMHEQMQSLLDTLLQGTCTALRQEFQNNTLYKGSEIEHVVKSVMRKQVLAGQQALSDLAPPAISGLAGPSP